MRALAVPIAVVSIASVIDAVVNSGDWFDGNVVLIVVLFLACVLAVVNSWDLRASAGAGRRPRAPRTPTRGGRKTGE